MPKVCPVCGTSYSDANIFCPADGSTLRAAESAHDLVGTVVADRYLITDLLGAGGMGTVYLARHVRLPQQAAIKVLKPELVRDAAAVARFTREAANASRVEHERIARVFDFGETAEGTVYLAMEYVPGPTLKQLLTKGGPMPPARVATLTRQVADALDVAHRLGIVHRDLKPDNIMVIEDAELGDRCKVVDFGIAKAMGSDSSEPGLTKTGFIVGTPEFMSPEQLFGSDIDHRSDVYALALVAYQCLTGALPFDASTPERTMTARLVEAPKPLATVRPDVTWASALQPVFDRGLAREREERFESAGAFARALEAAVREPAAGTGSRAPASVDGSATAASATAASATTASATAALAGGAMAASAATSAGRGALVSGGSNGRVTAAGSAAASHSAASHSAASSGTRGGPPIALIAGAAVVALAVVGWLATRGGDADDGTSPPSVATTSSQPSGSMAEQDKFGNEPSDERNSGYPAPTGGFDTSGAAASGASGPTSSGSGAGTTASTGTAPQADGTVDRTTAPTRPTDGARPDPAPTNRPVLSREAAQAARFTLDSLFESFDPARATAADARRVIGVVRGLMPRLGSAEDSAWGYLRQAEAHFVMEDGRSGCLAMAAARPLVRTQAQRTVLATWAPACASP